MATPVAVDTSALMLPVQHDVRLFEELERLLGAVDTVVPEPVVTELERLGRGGGTEGTAASVGAELAADRCEVVETAPSGADDAIVELAATDRVAAVVTTDRDLRDRVLAEDVSVIALRGRNKLAVTRP